MTGERCGSKPGRQWKDVYCAGCSGIVGGFSLANDGAGQVSIANVDPVRIFCLPRHTRMDAFAVGLKSYREVRQIGFRFLWLMLA